ncbi:sensor histidine kinase [Streptomyces xiamenensis]|uniref:sensor histidine kinase n=1 Tax=Streptomyces xiamenensis TaxID=408015 RepID=UPI0036C17BBE
MNGPRRTSRISLGLLSTIRARILIGVLLLLIVGLVGNSVASVFTLQSHLEERAESTLRDARDRIHRRLAEAPREIDGAQLATLAAPSIGVMVIDSHGEAAQQIAFGVPEPVNAMTRERPDQVLHLTDQSVPDLIALRIPTPGLTVTVADQRIEASAIVLALRTDLDRVTVTDFISRQASIVGTTVVLAAALGLAVLKYGLRPLGRMADAADALASGAREERLPVRGGHSETDRLAAAVNNAFDVQARAESNIRSFAADASHELRTPLATISGWLDLYHQGGLRDPGALDRAMERVDAEAGRMRALVEELSLLARLDAGRPLASQPLDLSAVAADVVDDARVVAPGRSITLHAPPSVLVVGDGPRLQQVLHNLVGNAIQHTTPGTPVQVSLTVTSDEALVCVSDAGPGMPAADLARVFDRFWRADASRNQVQGGSGLGLAIVQAVIHAHRGTVSIDSQPAAGTTVTVRLPRDSRALSARPPHEGPGER